MAKREPNGALGRLLTESRWTYRQFARAVNRVGTEMGTPLRYDESAVSHWLGGTVPRGAVRVCVLEALSRRLGRPVTHAEAGLPVPRDRSSTPAADTVEGLIDLGRQDMDPSRRSVLGVGLFSVALTIPGWPDVIGRAEAVQSGRARRIGMNEVDMVIAMTERVSELDDQFGGRHARPMAASFMVNTVASYLRADAPDDVRKAMLSAASDLLYLTGYMAVDEGLHGLAQRYYVKALELAGTAEDHLTYCTTLRGMSVQAIDLRHGGKAMELADAAAAASPKAGPRMLAFLAGQQAHAAAQTGDRTRALRYIREAETAMDRAESRGKAFGSYDPASLNYHISQVRYELGDVSGAIEAMQQSDKVRYGVYRRARVRHRAMLAERQLEVGHLEAACGTWHQALDDYPMVQSGRADDRVRTMFGLLRPHLKNTTARDLYDRARTIAPPSLVG
ncbi:tetratricopeptide repeat protein [Streptomyces sp. OUCMDZ-4982]|uniref:tetratricopeptide repeat protein n=1 Tax=Streptomyces sp. OUCMDZ-4982 TaxID=2973090 RepID=UPI00215D18D6|nr:tetratricopeptide repeat protein [Streptomyces sp. OUCMDZ-4982]MCR8946055.1 tetratricopeptide repeat protein [Streptomyces sp. OUCMDZ-4982]